MTHPTIQALIDLGPELESDFQWFKANNSPTMIKRFEIFLSAIAALKANSVEAGYVKVPRETSIIDGEDGPEIGILIDLPDGRQIWSGEVSKSLFNEQGEIAMDSLGGNDNGVFVMLSNSVSTEIVCRAASVDHGINIARALASIAAALSPASKEMHDETS